MRAARPSPRASAALVRQRDYCGCTTELAVSTTKAGPVVLFYKPQKKGRLTSGRRTDGRIDELVVSDALYLCHSTLPFSYDIAPRVC